MPDLPTDRPRRPHRSCPESPSPTAAHRAAVGEGPWPASPRRKPRRRDGSARPMATSPATTAARFHPPSREPTRTVSPSHTQEADRPHRSRPRPRRRAGLIALAAATTVGLLVPAWTAHAATAGAAAPNAVAAPAAIPAARRTRTRASPRPTRSTATPVPAGQARSPTRSGCRSTSAPRTPSAAWCSTGRRPTRPRSRSRRPPTAPRGRPSTRPPPVPAGCRPST